MVKRLLGWIDFLGQSMRIKEDLDEQPEGIEHETIMLPSRDPLAPVDDDDDTNLSPPAGAEDEGQTRT